MDEDAEVAVVARVRVGLPDGSEETWLVPMRLADDAVSYAATLYPPESAAVLGVEPLVRSRRAAIEVVVARADVASS